MKVKSKLRVSNLICIVIFPPAVMPSPMFFDGNFLLEYENSEDSIPISPLSNLLLGLSLQPPSALHPTGVGSGRVAGQSVVTAI